MRPDRSVARFPGLDKGLNTLRCSRNEALATRLPAHALARSPTNPKNNGTVVKEMESSGPDEGRLIQTCFKGS